MAKAKKRTEPSSPDRLRAPMTAFAAGDYPRARGGFAAVASDPEASSSEQATARALHAATRPDPLTLAVGGACLALFAAAAVLTALIQP